jgi:signal transduction histidine kinase
MTGELERQLAGLKQGDHACLIYENASEQLAVAVPFVKDGLARNERCIYIADNRRAKEIEQALSAAGVDLDRERQRGALQILTKRDVYLATGRFEPQRMIDFVRQAESQALAEGFSGLRVTGEMTWALGPERGCERLIEYEALLNRLSDNKRSVLLCQYNRSSFEAPCIHDVFRTHPVAILGDQVCSNPHYEPPELVLDVQPRASAAFLAKRVDWWTAQLKRAQLAERERRELIERLQVLSRRLLEVQETERRHLARELHDEIGQMLTGLKLLLKPALPSPGPGGGQGGGGLAADAVKIKFDQARRIVDDLLAKLRGLSFDLRPVELDQLGLLSALRALFERYTNQTGVRVNFKQAGLEPRFGPEVETAAYRIVQEALTNVARHAKVKEVAVRLWLQTETLQIQIEDQGVGFDSAAILAAGRSSGLAGMNERVTILGGRLVVDSAPGSGTHLLAELPLTAPPGESTR